MEEIKNQYLSYLNLTLERPSINYLQRLIQHHLIRIPYETFSKFHYFNQRRELVPSLDQFVHNLTNRGWGGTCYTLNINFGRLLRELGFSIHFVRVTPGHLGIMVDIEGKKLYADVGYGSPIMKPVELESRRKHVLHGFGEEITFTQKDQALYEIDRKSNGKSFVKKEIIWLPLDEEDLDRDIEASYQDREDNVVMRRITAVRFHGNTCYFLRNGTIKAMTYRNIREYQMRDIDKWINTVNEIYHFDKESIQESVDFLQERNIKIFT
ncbi:arylamine N-acetyltransferase [Bacillus salacetis]|uniref:arylamine N-acetyltransferase n=1 Tax=Bacillus salacetis TaxID=2315464 RepID=UPI0014441473|nr:arylamine N-acetyltransferase [Bacillus salacetis]